MILFLAIIIILTLLTLGLPIAYAFFLAAIFIIVTQGLPLDVVSLVPFYMIDSFPLMAVPFFILAGTLMEESQITEKIFDIFNAIVGRMRGGLGSIAVLSCMFFAIASRTRSMLRHTNTIAGESKECMAKQRPSTVCVVRSAAG